LKMVDQVEASETEHRKIITLIINVNNGIIRRFEKRGLNERKWRQGEIELKHL
jgi:hypothetical protein